MTDILIGYSGWSKLLLVSLTIFVHDEFRFLFMEISQRIVQGRIANFEGRVYRLRESGK